MPEGLIAEQLQADLASGVIGREIVVLDQAGSTNDAILQIANANSNEGLVVFAEHQTAGRGQRGNRWESAAGKGLWFSILLRPRIDLASSPQLTAWAAEAVSNAIQNEFSLIPVIKPPNDVQIDGGKVAGVLVEMRAQQNATSSGYRRYRGQRESISRRFSEGTAKPRNLPRHGAWQTNQSPKFCCRSLAKAGSDLS